MRVLSGFPSSVLAPGGASGTPPRKCVRYVLLIFALGSAAVASSAITVVAGGQGYSWLALGVLTVLGGSFALKVPRVPATVSLSEVFIFTTILSFGQAPATLVVAADGLITSIRRRNRKLHRILFNIGEPALSVWIASALFSYLSGLAPLAQAEATLTHLLLPVLVMSTAYFLLNSGLTALAVTLENGGSAYELWRTHFAWLSLNDFGSASIALFLALSAHDITLGSLAAALPLLVLLYFAFQAWIREIENASDHLAQLNRLHLATVESLAMAVDARDQATHGHIRRVQTHSLALAKQLGITDELQLKALEVAALLHDTGKIAVPDHILNKPGRLTPAEYDWMKRHTVIGASILSAVDFPYPVVPIVRHHHESWDGTGYPDGLRATEIPVGARILSVIDCYDALTSDRPYRRALTQEAALAVIQQRRGSMYDPQVVDAFLQIAPHLPEVPGDRARPLGWGAIESPPGSLEPATAARPPRDEPLPATCHEILMLGELAGVLAERVSFEDAAELLARQVRRLTPAALVVFYRADRAAGSLTVAHASGAGEQVVRDLRLQLGQRLSGWVAATGSTMQNADPGLDLGGRVDRIAPQLQSALCTPVVHESTVIGVIALYAPGLDAFTTGYARVVDLVSRSAVAAFAARDREADRVSAGLDAATLVTDQSQLERLMVTCSRLARPYPGSRAVMAIEVPSAVLLDEADTLQRAVVAVKEAIRGADLIVRPAANELLVLLPEVDGRALESIRGRVMATLEHAADTSGRTSTFGMASAPTDGSRWAELVDTARARRRVRTADLPAVREFAYSGPYGLTR